MTLEEAQEMQSQVLAGAVDWVCSKNCECKHEWSYTPWFEFRPSGNHGLYVAICNVCDHVRNPNLVQLAWPMDDEEA